MSEEKEKLQESVARLDGDVKKLEKRVQESTERERLIIEYPDLNGPVNPDLAGMYIHLSLNVHQSLMV